MPDYDSLLARAEQAIELAKQKGADSAWADASRVRSLETHVREGKLERVQDNTSRGLSLRLFVAGRYSTHSTSDLEARRFSEFVGEAIELTRALQPDPHRHLSDPALYAGRCPGDLDLDDPRVSEIQPEARLAWCEEMHAPILGQNGLISVSSVVYDSQFQTASASSNGFSDSWGATSVGMYTSVTLKDKGEARPADGMGVSSRRLDALLSPTWVGEEALRRARARLGSTKGPTVVAPMVVDPQAVGRLLGALLGSANGGAIQQGQSFWKDKLGVQVVADKLSVVDDPLVRAGLGSRPYDGEGIAAKRMELMQAGTLQNYYIDTYYGSKLGMPPTAGGSSNQIVALGSGDLAKQIADVGSGVYVTSWLGGNSDSTTGDFSFGIQGHMIEHGRVAGAVSEMNISGNLLDLFSQLRAVGDDPWLHSSLRAPTFVFDGVQFSGK
ncbi:MAG: TldD/PmbA family protein [Nannocystaceae bacterium]